MAGVGIESIRMQQTITHSAKYKVKEHNVHMLQQYHRTTDKLETSFIKFCTTTPVFLKTKHEIQMGEAAPIESTWCISKRSEGRITR
jgi:hypothetical protein